MAAKGLSHFFQKDKVVEIPYRFVCSILFNSSKVRRIDLVSAW